MITILITCLIITAYLFGSLSTAIILSRIMKLPDPRSLGSGNPGATNMLRIGGKKLAVLTLLGDLLKGLIPVLIAHYFGLNSLMLAVIALAAFLGHLYPIFFGFQGGKGVATAIGTYLALSPIAGLCAIVTWISTAVLFRYSSLASLVAAVCAPFYLAYFMQDWGVGSVITLMSIVLIYRHRGNICNLIQGKENQIGKRVQVCNDKRG